MSVKQLADQGYTTIFHPYLQGVTVHDNDGFKLVTSKPPLLQGWRDTGGLWTVPLVEETAMNIYELLLTKEERFNFSMQHWDSQQRQCYLLPFVTRTSSPSLV
jgi:hypothetical protein